MNRNPPSNSLGTFFHTSSDIPHATTNTAANGSATDPHLERISKQLFDLVKHVLQKEASSSTAAASGPDRSSYAHLGISIDSGLYSGASGNTAADAKVKEVYKHALRILASRLTPSVVTDETHLADQVKKKLIREHKSSAKAIRFSNLYGKLSSQTALTRRWAIMYFLLSTSEKPSSHSMEFNSLGDLAPVEQSFAAMGLQNISSAATPNQSREDDPRSNAHIFGKHRNEDDGSDSSKVSQMSGLAAYRQYLAAGDSMYEVSEAALLRDAIFMFQGIDGRYVKFAEDAGSYVIDNKVAIPRSTRDLIHRLSELGWLYKRVQIFVRDRADDISIGLVGQSFCSALQRELTDYYRLIAVLEAQIVKDDPNSRTGSVTTKGLSLKRLLVWTQDSVQRLRLMSTLVDVCAEQKGGQLVNTIYGYTSHGDPFIHDFINHLLEDVSKPFYEMLQRWIYEGELEDPYNEFFVACDVSVQEEELWLRKYSMREDMLPSFIGKALAQKIFSIGKSLNFIRYSCHDDTLVSKPGDSVSDHLQVLKYGDIVTVESSIDAAYIATSRRLLDLLSGKYKLMDHFGALKRYLLLGQGDFIQYLMDSLGDGLDKPANTLFRHNLTGTLETAVRASNAQYDDPDILGRLDVRLLEISPGDLGWDVFTLDYHVDSPINTVFTPQAMHQYLKLFNFLWRLKRVEHTLSAAWRRMVTSGRKFGIISEIVPDLHQTRIVVSEMIHFVYQLQYYYLFEVLECSWDELINFIQNKCIDLNSLINAHSRYLNGITDKGFLVGSKNQNLSMRLVKIFDAVLQYKLALDRLTVFALAEVERREKIMRDAEKRTKSGKWGLTEDDGDIDRLPEGEFEDKLPKIRSRLQETSSKFKEEVHALLAVLSSYQDEDLRSLSTRLNYNEYYRQPEIASGK